MVSVRRYLPLFLVFFSLISCKVNKNERIMHLEIMQPGIFYLPENHNTIAIFNRDLYKTDSCVFKYYNGHKTATDSSIKYSDLSNRCVDALSGFLKDQGYFKNIINYRDSFDCEIIQDIYKADEYIEKSNADVCVFLNRYNLKNTMINADKNLVHTEPCISWSVQFKDDSTSYLYNQTEILNFYKSQFPKLYGIHLKIKPFMNQAAQDLAILFGTRLIPVWQNAERTYYRSKNQEMLVAEKFAFKNDWLKAAEIWNRQSTNENPGIAGKACFNMALACEMEGRPDIALDWLNKSKLYRINDIIGHRLNCTKYIAILSERKEKIESLKKQVR